MVVGGGYIGLELGSVWSRLGAAVTIVEMMPTIAGATDGQIGRTLLRVLKKQGLSFKLQTKVVKAEVKKKMVHVTMTARRRHRRDSDLRQTAGGGRTTAADRRAGPLTRWELRSIPAGRIDVDESYRTKVKTIYAVGDLIEGPMLGAQGLRRGAGGGGIHGGNGRGSQL